MIFAGCSWPWYIENGWWLNLLGLGWIFSFYPFIPSAFQNINLRKSLVHHFPCQTDTGMLKGSCSVEYDRLCFGIPGIPALEFVWVFLNSTFDFDATFLPILGSPYIQDDYRRIFEFGFQRFFRYTLNFLGRGFRSHGTS